MAYERKGRQARLDGVMIKPPEGLSARSDLVTRERWNDVNSASSGASSVVGRPVSTYETLPAGGKGYSGYQELEVPNDWIPSEGRLYFNPIRVPEGYVLVVTSWQVVLAPRPVRGDVPFSVARVLNTEPIGASLLKNRMPEAGSSQVQFATFDGPKPCHVVAYGDDVLSAEVAVFGGSSDLFGRYPQLLELHLEGVLLLPNTMAPEYTELMVGAVRIEK